MTFPSASTADEEVEVEERPSTAPHAAPGSLAASRRLLSLVRSPARHPLAPPAVSAGRRWK